MARFALLSLIPFLLALCACTTPTAPQLPMDPDGPVRVANKWSYDDCGTAEFFIQLESIEVVPDPPKPGHELTIKAKGVVTDIIEEGAYADVTVKLGLIKLLHKQFDVCEEARNANASVACPVKPGKYLVQQKVMLPREIPKAKFTVAVRAFTVDEEDLLCLNLHVDFLPKLPFLVDW
ncbi:hypothetical protein APHAL10511_006316 [Amanita phalloides]|nr:hypothetical protein APHAL10511_006316 [Amanita phalloides]